ncbi:MAG: ABC transporter ATP-binding protein [Oscillospiraceae bacterium]|nr:ABC transporter ATP-binding protein [Oscillospiraceae bacterium]
MIRAEHLHKNFDDFAALSDMTINVKSGSVYGLIGVNGSGKTTALKTITGIIRPDGGEVDFDGEPVYENLKVKQRMGFIPDDLHFFGSYTLKDSAQFYKRLFLRWDNGRYREMLELFALPESKRLSRFSKGMLKQAAFILTMATKPDYLILDEPIDGLDPIVRKLVWKYIMADVAEREMSVLVSSHNLREMEGVCDTVGIVDKGRIVLERDLDELRSDIHKVQAAWSKPADSEVIGNDSDLKILRREKSGAVEHLIIRANRDLLETKIGELQPLVFDLLPLSLEEIFIYELGGERDALKQLLF